VVGFLVDSAGVDVVLIGDHDADGDVDGDDFAAFAACFSGEGVEPDDPQCQFFDFDLDTDVDCSDWDAFAASWTGPGRAPTFWPCNLLPPAADTGGARSLIVTPPEHGLPLALRVTGDPDDPTVWCLSKYVQSDGRLGPDPVFHTDDVWSTLVVSSEEIVPGAAYHVWCDYGEYGMCDEGVAATTAAWGDVVGNFVDGAWTPANGVVDFNDITSVVDAFKHLPAAPPAPAADLVGASGSECVPDQSIDFLDIGAAVDAFKGHTYSASTSCPVPCF
jgi:hypothetical protein